MKEIMPLLEKLADRLGVAVDLLWAALVRQASNEAIGYIILWSVTLVAFIFGICLIHGMNKRERTWLSDKENSRYNYDWDRESLPIVCTVASAIVFFIGLCTSLIDLPKALACFNNPEFVALNHILRAIAHNVQ